jgi:site-specific recombinase XerD
MPSKSNRPKCDQVTMSGPSLAQLLLYTGPEFVRWLERQCSVRRPERIIREYAQFCEGQGEANPWQLREKYLVGRYRPVRAAVTRRHLIWLEQQGHLPAGTAGLESRREKAPRTTEQRSAWLESLVSKVDRQLPEGLRQPLLDYLEYLVYQRGLVKTSLEAILSTNLALCRRLASTGQVCFAQLDASTLDRVVWSLLTAPPEREHLLRRRQQIQAQHSRLRGFLRHLQRRGLLSRDLAQGLISPPCYQAARPATVLSQQQVRSLLETVDRDNTRGWRLYAILVLMTTYGLRPMDISRLSLDALHWHRGQLAIVQKKTGRTLTLPLLPEVVTALSNYLCDRVPGLVHRRVFVSLNWPHTALGSKVISTLVTQALRQAGIGWACPRHLRSTVATHLLRQGEGHSTIQQILGHCSAETTQRYAVTDVELLRQVLEESER